MFDDFTTQIQCEEVYDEAMYEAWLEIQEAWFEIQEELASEF